MAYYNKNIEIMYKGWYEFSPPYYGKTIRKRIWRRNLINNISNSAYCFLKVPYPYGDNMYINDFWLLVIFKKDGSIIPLDKMMGSSSAINFIINSYALGTLWEGEVDDKDSDVLLVGYSPIPEPPLNSNFYSVPYFLSYTTETEMQRMPLVKRLLEEYGDKIRICPIAPNSTMSNMRTASNHGYTMDIKDAPSFDNYNDLKKYIDTGKWTPPIHIDYNLWIDGTNKPSISVEWDSSLAPLENANIRFKFKAVSSNPFIDVVGDVITTIPYSDNHYNFLWSEIYQRLDANVPIIDYFINNKFRIEIFIEAIDEGIVHDSVGVDLYEKIHSGEMYDNLKALSNDKDTLTIGKGEGEISNDDDYNIDDSVDDSHTSTDSYDIGAVNFVTCYKMSVSRLNNIASKLWDNSFFDNIALLNNSPIENIISCKLLPIDTSGSESEIKIGNINMGVNGQKLPSTVKKITIGSISIPRMLNYGFLNYSPYTSITIFLPFCGFKELNVNDIMGRTITIDCVVDYITGAIKYIILLGQYQIYEFDGNCGIDIPLSQSNRANVEVGYIQSALGVVGGVATKNPFMLANSIESAIQPYHYQTQGTYSPSTGACEDRTIYLIIDRPKYTNISSFGHVKGYKCQLTKTLKNLSGFVKTTDNVDLSNISAPKYCKDLILDLLSSGIYV